MPKIKLIELENTQQYPALNVELLGRPIHIVREELKQILLQASSSLTHELQRWIKNNALSVSLIDIELNRANSETFSHPAAVFQHQLGGLLNSHLSEQLLLTMADSFYSADIARNSDVEKSKITSSDMRLQQRIGQIIAQHVAPEEMWEPVDSAISEGVGLSARFNITFQDSSAELTAYFDATLVQTLINELDQEPAKPIDKAFKRALEHTPVRVNARLCQKTMPLDQVLNLQPNDIIDIDLLSNVPVSVGQEQLFSARVAEQNGQLVLILNNVKD
ncbi:FliM/FliN family flagellar motor C-terminal domain-containing protein [Photobacterium sp.]|uniref:FliM/FliN family flagellar motor C-terminal domain-containing protein n=1 Tax=Photobacterium sp. TaxID=660 RepID=UPI00299D6C51|nr:FliM/FliN family flagellar motor C-terminal domain-containing protein [Photobacterium sp.]MDX1301071.1 FliM/FliN family flagellar motor C-terminal domain-containing protein [Photobacterium sp.]